MRLDNHMSESSHKREHRNNSLHTISPLIPFSIMLYGDRKDAGPDPSAAWLREGTRRAYERDWTAWTHFIESTEAGGPGADPF